MKKIAPPWVIVLAAFVLSIFIFFFANGESNKPEKVEPDVYYDLITKNAIEGDSQSFQKINRKLYESQDLAAALIDYNYNMLMSVAENAILFTNGDNDTYPAWMLQVVKNIRKDVTILNIHLNKKYPDYLKRNFSARGIELNAKEMPLKDSETFVADLCQVIHQKHPNIPIYLAVTVALDHIKPIRDQLYLVGLAYKFSPERFDNVARLKENWVNHFRLDYLHHNWYSEPHPSTPMILTQLNQNYIPPLLMLYEHYIENDNQAKAEQCKAFAIKIAKKTGQVEAVQHYIENINR